MHTASTLNALKSRPWSCIARSSSGREVSCLTDPPLEKAQALDHVFFTMCKNSTYIVSLEVCEDAFSLVLFQSDSNSSAREAAGPGIRGVVYLRLSCTSTALSAPWAVFAARMQAGMASLFLMLRAMCRKIGKPGCSASQRAALF